MAKIPDYTVSAPSAASTGNRRKRKPGKATTVKRRPKADLLKLSKSGNKTAKKALSLSIDLHSGPKGFKTSGKGNLGKVTKSEPKTTTLTDPEGNEYEHTSKAKPVLKEGQIAYSGKVYDKNTVGGLKKALNERGVSLASFLTNNPKATSRLGYSSGQVGSLTKLNKLKAQARKEGTPKKKATGATKKKDAPKNKVKGGKKK